MGHADRMDRCPSCGAEFADRTLDSVKAGQRRQLRRCPSCQRLATRETPTDDWTDAGTDPSLDYLFDWQPKPLPEPWYLVPAEQRTALETELQTELGPQHPLFGQKPIAVARCAACDDVIFSIEAEPAASPRCTSPGGEVPNRLLGPGSDSWTCPCPRASQHTNTELI